MRERPKRRRLTKPLITWTEFHLPQGQEWPVWTVEHDNVHIGPLVNMGCCYNFKLARMVDKPDYAAYIIGKYLYTLLSKV